MIEIPILEGNIIRLRPMEIDKDKYSYYKFSKMKKCMNGLVTQFQKQ